MTSLHMRNAKNELLGLHAGGGPETRLPIGKITFIFGSGSIARNKMNRYNHTNIYICTMAMGFYGHLLLL